MLVGNVFDRLRVLLKRGVVDEDVERSIFVDRLLHGGATEIRIAHVAGDEETAAAFVAFDDALRFFRVDLLDVEVDDRDVRAFAREQHRDRAADAGVAAGDDRDFALELAASLILRRAILRARLQLRFDAGLLLMLLRQRILRLLSRARLHGLVGFLVRRRLRIDAALHSSLFGDSPVVHGRMHGSNTMPTWISIAISPDSASASVPRRQRIRCADCTSRISPRSRFTTSRFSATKSSTSTSMRSHNASSPRAAEATVSNRTRSSALPCVSSASTSPPSSAALASPAINRSITCCCASTSTANHGSPTSASAAKARSIRSRFAKTRASHKTETISRYKPTHITGSCPCTTATSPKSCTNSPEPRIRAATSRS